MNLRTLVLALVAALPAVAWAQVQITGSTIVEDGGGPAANIKVSSTLAADRTVIGKVTQLPGGTATTGTLQAALVNAGANSTIILPANYSETITSIVNVSNSNVKIECKPGATLTASGSSGLQGDLLKITGANIEVSGCTLNGSSQVVIEVASTANGANIHDCTISGGGTANGSSASSGGLIIDAPNADISVANNTLTANGIPGSPHGQVVRTDGLSAGYVQRLRFQRNHVFGNFLSAVYLYDIANSDVSNNFLDENNQCGTGCASGGGYGIMAYSQNYIPGSVAPTSVTRASGVVTAVIPNALSWTPAAGQQILVTQAPWGTNKTDFNGVFTLQSVSADGKTYTWNQPNVQDDAITPPHGVIQSPLQNNTISNNIVQNAGASGIYVQGVSDTTINGNAVINTGQQQATGDPDATGGVTVGGGYNVTVTNNVVDTSEDTAVPRLTVFPGINISDLVFGSVAGNTVTNIYNGFGIQTFKSERVSFAGNYVHNIFSTHGVGGIGYSSTTTMNCAWCSFSGNTVNNVAAGPAYYFAGFDINNTVIGGEVHGPQGSAGSSSAIYFGPNTQGNSVVGVDITCTADNTSTPTYMYGIRSAGTGNVFRSNRITGCAQTGGAGIFDTGHGDKIMSNQVTGSYYGGLSNSTGNTPSWINNVLWGNTTALQLNTGAYAVGNITTHGNYPK